jgi:glucokinase
MRTDESVVVGVEVAVGGATVALIDHLGKVNYRLPAKTLWGRPVAATLEPYLRAIDTILAHASAQGLHVCGLAVSIPGSLDSSMRRPLLVPTLPALNGFPLCDLLEARYGIPTQLHIDVEAAALGEYHFGPGKGCHRLLFLTINAIVGAAFLIHGKPERPAQQYLGHVCHIAVSTNGPRCSCGKHGCINTLVSTDAMQRIVQRALRRGEETSLAQRLSNHEYFSPRLLTEEALRGDSIALQVYSEIGRWLGVATARYISFFEPDILILAGSIFDESDLLLTQVRNAFTANSSSQESKTVEIVSAHLGSDAALIGMAVPLISSDLTPTIRPPLPLADVIHVEPDDQSSQTEHVLDDIYPIHSDVISQQTRRHKAKSYQRRAG